MQNDKQDSYYLRSDYVLFGFREQYIYDHNVSRLFACKDAHKNVMSEKALRTIQLETLKD
ncbi:hypothetical protein J2W48_001381 [Flavobacterium piscis]|uniref:Uncharacterized protein n=1 Tax=Flavobacterium piscis TaxID=1114874 RepID=A0ABU1Y5W3_9FLAO|nr:hypothetical protein [Flavobacterium piscis]